MKSVIITGGNSGLGYQCAKVLGQSGGEWAVFIAGRDKARVEKAVSELRSTTRNANIHGLQLDLASFVSIREFAAKWAEGKYPPLHGLVCNAGVQIISGTTYTQEGFETTFAVNHLGHFLLANLLIPCMERNSQIVWVSSDTHDPTKKTGMPAPRYTTPELLAHPQPANTTVDNVLEGRIRYTTSKLCNLYTVYEMDRRLQQKHMFIRVNAFNPAMMPGTGLARDYSPVMKFAWNYVLPMMSLVSNKIRTPSQSGNALARLFLDSEIAAVSGKYFDGYKPIRSSDESYDLARAKELWDISARLTLLDKSW